MEIFFPSFWKTSDWCPFTQRGKEFQEAHWNIKKYKLCHKTIPMLHSNL
jgi:hypothetical protein